MARIKSMVMGVVAQHFRPEFINRVDDIVVFHPLAAEHVRAIAGLQFEILSRRLEEQDIRIELAPAAMDALVDEGYDPVYGARPLKRAIQQQLENPLAQRILQGEFAPGSTIHVHAGEAGLSFSA